MRVRSLLFLPVTAVLASSCASTRIDEAWMDPQWNGKPVRKILVVGIAESDLRRRSFEDLFVGILRERGNDASASYPIIPVIDPQNTPAAEAIIAQGGFDAILTARAIGVETETTVIPGSTYYTPTSYYDGFYNYYATSYQMVSTPTYVTQYEIWKVETNVYYAKTGKLVWTGQSSTSASGNFQSGLKDFSDVIIQELGKRGLIR